MAASIQQEGLLETAVLAARIAGKRALDEMKNIKSSVKNDIEMVTQADAFCQQMIIDQISKSYPSHGVLGEEGDQGRMFRKPPRDSEDTWWVIDPIDGTNNYAHGLLTFVISIAAFREGEPVVAVIFEPATGSMFSAATGISPRMNESPIHVKEETIDRFSCFGIDSHPRPEMAEAIRYMMTNTRFRNLGATALHLAYVAKGSMIGTITTNAKLWDIAAGAYLVEAAGGIVTDLYGRRIFPVDVAAYQSQKYAMISANQTTHPDLMKLFGNRID